MKFLVTGASGFIGRLLCKALQDRGDSVTACLRIDSEGPWNRVLVGDLSREVPSAAELGDIDCVVHLAGKAHALNEFKQDDDAYFRVNAEATRKLLQSCKAAKIQRFIFISSVKACDVTGTIPVDEAAVCNPRTAYGRSKLEAERLVLNGGYVPEPMILRLTMVYGPTAKGNLPQMISAIHRGYFPPFRDSSNSRSMVHVADVIAAVMLAADQPAAAGQTYIVTGPRNYSTGEIYQWICEALGKPIPTWEVPTRVLCALAKIGDAIGSLRGKRFLFDSDALDKLIGSEVYSSAKIQRELGFRPERELRTSLPEIIAFLGIKP